MVASMKLETQTSQKRPVLLAFKILIASFFGLITIAVWSVGAVGPAKLFISLFLIAIASLVFRWGWVIPCTIVGIFCGLAMDNVVKGGSIESQMWETVRCICFGFFFGFWTGFVLDLFRSNELSEEAEDIDNQPTL